MREAETVGPYELGACLGEGAVGRVFRATDTRDGRAVAVKALRSPTPDAIARFKDEFRLLKDLNHPNLVQLGELLHSEGRWYFAMELVEGTDVLSYVRGLAEPSVRRSDSTVDDRTPSPDTTSDGLAPVACRLDRLYPAFAQLARGLAALHAAGKVHRDVKPSNVVVEPSGRVVLVDFGLVLRATDASPGAGVVGTPRYMAPEQARGEAVGPAADWYAFGAMLFEALVGRPPFVGRPAEVLTKKQTREPLRPRALAPSTPHDLDVLSSELLAFDPHARPGAQRVVGDLERTFDAAAPERPLDSLSLDVAGFVGRDQELAQLRALFESATEPAAALIEGESGVGKSTLARAFADEAARQGALVLWGRPFEHESVPFKAMDGVVDAIVPALRRLPDDEVTGLLPKRIELLAETFPVLKRVPAVRRRPQAPRIEDPAVRRAHLFEVVRDLFVRLAGRTRILLAIDDIQWADVDSLTMLAELLRPPVPSSLFFLAIRRATLDAPAPTAQALLAAARRIEVGGLLDADSRTLADRLLRHHGRKDASGRAEQIAREAAGHPLFLDALARYAGESAATPHPRLEEALGWRIGGLSARSRRLLGAICLATRPVAREVGVAAAELDADGGARAIAELAFARLVRTSAAEGDTTLEPYHDRIREAAVARLDHAERREGHGRLALALEDSKQGDVEELLEQWAAAGEPATAAQYARRAADRAFDALAFDAAASFYARAFAVDPPRDPAVATRYADALAHSAQCAAASKAYEQASLLAGPAERLELRNRAAEQLLRGGHLDEGMARLRAVFADRGLVLPRSRSGSVLALAWERALVALLFVLVGWRRPREASELPPAVLARLDFAWWAGPTLGLVDPILGNLLQARHLRYALLAGERTRLACAIAAYGGFSALRGAPARARSRRLLARARAMSRGDDAYLEGVLAFTTHVVAYLEGRFGDEREAGDTCERIFREQCVGKVWECDSARFFNLSAIAYTGAMDSLALRRDGALAEARHRGNLYAQVHYRIGVTAMARLAANDPEGARAEVDDALRLWTSERFGLQHWYGALAACQIDLFVGRPEDALDRIDRIWRSMRGALLFRVEHVRVAATNLRARCRLAAAAKARGAARVQLLRAAERDTRKLAGEGDGWGPAFGALVAARLPSLRGDSLASSMSLLAAADRCESLGFRLHAASARRRAGELVGGTEGDRLIEDADAWMRSRSVRDPGRLSRVLCP